MRQNSEKKNRREYVWEQLSLALYDLFITIKQSSSNEQVGISGIIVDETYNLLKIKTNTKFLWIQKKNRVFEIELEDKSRVIVEGDLLIGKPEDRIKKKFFNW